MQKNKSYGIQTPASVAKDDIVHKEFHKEDLRFHTRQDKEFERVNARLNNIEVFLDGLTKDVVERRDNKLVRIKLMFMKIDEEEGNHEI